MTQDDIIRMARQAGFIVDEPSRKMQPQCINWPGQLVDEPLSLFAELVAEAEREACAQEAEHWQKINSSHQCGAYIAGAIRARGQK